MKRKNLFRIIIASTITVSITGGAGGVIGYNLGKYLYEPIKIENMNINKYGPQVIRIEDQFQSRKNCSLNNLMVHIN
jgi:hypothetical protein